MLIPTSAFEGVQINALVDWYVILNNASWLVSFLQYILA